MVTVHQILKRFGFYLEDFEIGNYPGRHSINPPTWPHMKNSNNRPSMDLKQLSLPQYAPDLSQRTPKPYTPHSQTRLDEGLSGAYLGLAFG